MTRLTRLALYFGVLLGCADTNALPPDPLELLVVANSQANSLTIAPVATPEQDAARSPRHGAAT